MGEALEEHADHPLSSIGTRCCLVCYAVVSTAVLTCCIVLLLLLLLLFFFSDCGLVWSVNLRASKLLCDAPGPRVWTPNLGPFLRMCPHPMLHFPLPLPWPQSGLICQSLCTIGTSLRRTWPMCLDTKLVSNSSGALSESDACSLSRFGTPFWPVFFTGTKMSSIEG